jgi:hypothetical protein
MKLVYSAMVVVSLVAAGIAKGEPVDETAEVSPEVIEAIARAEADIEKFGWHLLAVSGDGAPGFLYTIGLWRTHKHPELLLFAPGEDPSGMAGRLEEIVKRIAGGEKLSAGKKIEGGFGKHSGAVREIRQEWYPSYLGFAGAIYGDWEFPALQVFWPDQAGRFPWHPGFDAELARYQPLLDQQNPILANLGLAEIETLLAEEGGEELFAGALAEILVDPAGSGDLLEAWRWKVGAELQVFKVTVFGDLLLSDQAGRLHWLDIGQGTLEKVPFTRETWLPAFYAAAFQLVHAPLLAELRERGAPLAKGEVYDWSRPPKAGDAFAIENIRRGPLKAVVAAAGQRAQRSQKN